MSVTETKQALRTKARAERLVMPMAEISHAICEQLKASEVFKAAEVVLAYWPLSWEVDCRSLMTEFLEKAWYLPRITDAKQAKMEFYCYSQLVSLEEGPYGLMEPELSQEAGTIWQFSEASSTLIILPALMVDHVGTRLGAGKGYYDRFLANVPLSRSPRYRIASQTTRSALFSHPSLSLISPIPEAHYVANLPREPWDISLDAVVSEIEFYNTSNRERGVSADCD